MVKCDKEALRCRQEGNKQYTRKQFQVALKLYNESIRSCQFGDPHYFYAMGNKSALLFETKQFKQSKDIIEFIYTVETFLGLFESKKKYIEKLNNRLQSCDEQLTSVSVAKESASTEIGLSKGPFIYSALTTDTSSTVGRCVFTSANLKPNETLFCVKPFTAVLGSPFWASHCYTCFKYIKDSIVVPCNGCSEVQFCSASCFKENIVHQNHECSEIEFMKEIGLFHLGTSVIFKFHINDKLGEVFNIYEQNCEVHLHPCSLSDPELEITSLFSSSKARQKFYKSNLDFLQTIFDKLFSNSSFVNVTSDLISRTLSAITCQMMMNASTVMYYDRDACSNVAIGSGIYPAIAKMNHSCYTNTVCLFNGTAATVKTTQNIALGSELLNSYGVDFESVNKHFRQEHLKSQYDFDCRCAACVNDWKRNDHMRVLVCETCSTTVYVSSPDVKCSKCSSRVGNTLVHVKILEEEYNKAFECFQQKEYQKGLQILTCSMEQIKVLQMPDPLLLDWNDLVKKFIVLVFNEDI